MKTPRLTPKEQKALREYYDERLRIASNAPAPDPFESAEVRTKRKERLRGNFEEFSKYYFPKYMKADFGYFHKDAAKNIIAKKKILAILEWPRAHAKSVFANIMLPLFLKANNELSGMIVTSQNYVKAVGLLVDIQIELKTNARYIADYGEQYSFGDWSEGQFSTRDGIGFWAFGRGQSPRGTRNAEKRPDYITVDDIDDEEIIENQDRVLKVVKWVREALWGCFDLTRGRMVVAGNRIDQRSILAHLVGDVEEDDVVNPAIYHCKVFALENPKTHKEDHGPKAVPAWMEFYTRQMLEENKTIMGSIAYYREYFHQHVKPGRIFLREWFQFVKLPPLANCQHLLTYLDPSWKGTAKSDFKALLAIAKNGKFYDVYKVWIRQTSPSKMCQAHYDMYEWLEENGAKTPFPNFMEANFMQDQLLEEYVTEAEARGYTLPIKGDKRSKPDKDGRIEANSAIFERGVVRFADYLAKDPDMKTFIEQWVNFPNGKHDDGPDAFEGGTHILNQKARKADPNSRSMGGKRRTNKVL